MLVVDPDLRLSAQRALLGAISPEIRLVKVHRHRDVITLTTIATVALGRDAEEALCVAATEIVADFPECRIAERLIKSADPLPQENVLEHGWVYQRREVG